MLSFFTAVIVAFADQTAKYMVIQRIVPGQIIKVTDFFNLTHTRNTGAVWGVMQQQNPVLVLLSVAVLAAVMMFYKWLVGKSVQNRIAIGIMSGGIAGNLMDRIKYGWVVDFLDFNVRGWHWPAFNVADIAICAGVAAYIIFSLWADRHAAGRNTADESEP